MNKTQIEWVKNPDGSQGYTWNPITGCLCGCEYCYARKLANTRLKERYLANKDVSPIKEGINNLCYDLRFATPFYPRFWSDRCNRTGMVMGKSPKGIFVCDMSDLFGIGIPEEWTHRVLDRCRDMCLHRFYLLTKQPQNLIKFSPFPDNCWVGFSAVDTVKLMQGLSDIEDVRAKVKFVSIEPFLEWSYGWTESYLVNAFKRAAINWVIIGAQTKPYKPPKIEWVIEIIKACDKARIPVFLKNNLMPLIIDQPRIPEWSSTNKGLRQEFPY